MKKPLLFALALLLSALALYLAGYGQDPTPGRLPDEATTAAAAAEKAAGGAAAPPAANERESVIPEAPAEPWLAHPYTFALDLRVVDALGLPVQGHRVRLALPDGVLHESENVTGADGLLVVRWSSRLPSGTVLLAERGGLLRRIAVQHGRPTALTVLGQGGGPRLRFGTSTVRLTLRNAGDGNVLATADERPRMHHGLHPHAVFGVAPAPIEQVSAFVGSLDLASVVGEITFTADVLRIGRPIPDNAEQQPASPPRITGVVFGADGEPAAKVPVVLLGAGPQPLQRTATNQHGQFAFDEVKPGEFVVRAGGAAAGLATCPAVTTTGETTVTLNLTRGATVRGRVLDADGAPVTKARVRWRARDGSWCDETETDDDGAFLLANLPGVPGTVTALDPKRLRPFPLAAADEVLCDAGELVLRAAAADGVLRIEPVLPDGLAGTPEIRVHCEALDLAATMPTPPRVAPPRDAPPLTPSQLEHLAAGWYRVAVLHPACGRIDAGRHWIDGEALCDLGRVVLPQPATACIDIHRGGADAPAEDEVELYRLRPDCDVHLEVREPSADFQLAPGDCAVFWTDAAGEPHVERFTAVKGERVIVPIGR